MDARTDEQLVTAHLGGERDALAGIYDRYADALYDTAAAMLRDRHEAADAMQDVFLITAERLGQLRDPTRLKPWLFAILRNEVYRRTKRRRRDRPTDFSALGMIEMAAPADPARDGATVAYLELAESVRSAAAGLDPRDQLILELSVRQGLGGPDLAAALGVTTDQSYVLVHRMRERVARSLGALTVARSGRKDCPELQRILAAWDGTFNVLVRKRVARHVDACDICGETKRRFAALTLLAAAPAFAAPPGLRELVLGHAGVDGAGIDGAAVELPYDFTAEGGFPTVTRVARRGAVLAMAVAIGTVVALGAGAAVVLSRGGGDDDAFVATRPVTEVQAAADAGSSSAPAATSPTVMSPTTTATAAAAVPTSSASITTTGVATTTTGVATTTTGVATTTTGVASATTIPAATAVATTSPPAVVVTTTTPPPPTTTTLSPPPPPPDPGFLELSSSVVDLGASSSSATLTLRNTGGTPIEWALEGEPAPFTWATGAQSLGPGASTTIDFALDRSPLAEGTVSRELTITTDGGSGGGPVEVRARIERAPVVGIGSRPRRLSCPWSAPPFIGATVSDESALSSVVLSWNGPGRPGSTTMAQRADEWGGRLDVEAVSGTWTYVVTATDERGNTGAADGTLTVDGC